MKHLILTLAILLTFASSHTLAQKTIEGDLYFQLIDYIRFFDGPDSVLTRFEKQIKTTNLDSISTSIRPYYAFLITLVDKKMLRTPFIRLRLDDENIVLVFLDNKEYDQVKNYTYNDLIRDKKKIRIKALVTGIDFKSFNTLKALKLVSVEKIDGETSINK